MANNKDKYKKLTGIRKPKNSGLLVERKASKVNTNPRKSVKFEAISNGHTMQVVTLLSDYKLPNLTASHNKISFSDADYNEVWKAITLERELHG